MSYTAAAYIRQWIMQIINLFALKYLGHEVGVISDLSAICDTFLSKDIFYLCKQSCYTWYSTGKSGKSWKIRIPCENYIDV